MQCIRSPPAPEVAFWGSCSGFCRTESQEMAENFLVFLRCKRGIDLMKPSLGKTKTTSCTYSDQQNTTAALRRKRVWLFSPKKIVFKGKKLLHIASKERRSSIWSSPLSVLEGVRETFQLEKVWAWNQMVVWGHLSLTSQRWFMGQCEMEKRHWHFW